MWDGIQPPHSDQPGPLVLALPARAVTMVMAARSDVPAK